MTTEAEHDQAHECDAVQERPVGGPVRSGWREGTLTRAKELESLCYWALANKHHENIHVHVEAVLSHIQAAREAAASNAVRFFQLFRQGSLMERAMSNLDAAEATLLQFASEKHLLGQLPGLLRHVQRHLAIDDPRRQELERVCGDPATANAEREKIVSITRAASSAAMREQVQVRSFRNTLTITGVAMALLAIGMAVLGFVNPTAIPLCFAPEEGSQAMVVCPTGHSRAFTVPDTPNEQDIDIRVREAATRHDILVVELVGLAAGAVAAAAAIRDIKGSSERYGVPIALAVLKLPMGAVTAMLGILLMRGQFVPGLSALDSSAQILAWALLFGYGQQLFMRFVDQQGQTVLNNVRSVDRNTRQK